ncbi:MAG: hypothetical protein QM756_44775 [Polyangiaceae bacterium]
MSDFPLKNARLRAGVSLVQVSAAAGCTPNTTARYEVAPESVRADKKSALDAIYTRLREGGRLTSVA